MKQSPSWEANSRSASQEIPTNFYGTRRFITVFTRPYHRSLSEARWIQSTPSKPISLRSILILSYHISLVLPSGLFPSWLIPTKILNSFLIYPMRATCPALRILLDLIILMFGEEYKRWSSLISNFLQTSVTSSLLDPNILLRTLFLRISYGTYYRPLSWPRFEQETYLVQPALCNLQWSVLITRSVLSRRWLSNIQMAPQTRLFVYPINHYNMRQYNIYKL
jgi:hypothetical protein